MRIGVVSDTHNNLRNVERIVDLFNAAGVERVVHTGDITQGKTLDALSRLHVPLVGVFGNNDERDSLQAAAARHGMSLADGPLTLDWAERRIVVVHDPRELEALPTDDHVVALHGHTHRQVIQHTHARLTLNPGECAGHMKGRNCVAVLDLALMAVEILRF